MRVLVTTAALALVLCASMALGQEAKELTEEEFRAKKADKDKCLLVLAHAHWSPNSKHAKGLIHKLAAYMPTSNYSEVEVAMFDVHKHRRLAHREGVVAPPEFIFYTFGNSPTHYPFHDEESMVQEMLVHIAEKLDNDRHHRMLAQERDRDHAKWNIAHPSPGKVVDFQTEEDFYLLTHDITRTCLVMFYAKWCGACKEYSSDLDKIAKYFEPDIKMVIAKVDAEKLPNIADKYKVDGYPTLVVFFRNREGKTGMQYHGEREPSEMQAFLDQHHQAIIDYTGENSRLQEEMERMVEKDGKGLEQNWRDGNGDMQHQDPHGMPKMPGAH